MGAILKRNYFPGCCPQSTLLVLLVSKDVWNGMTESEAEASSVVADKHARTVANGRKASNGVVLPTSATSAATFIPFKHHLLYVPVHVEKTPRIWFLNTDWTGTLEHLGFLPFLEFFYPR